MPPSGPPTAVCRSGTTTSRSQASLLVASIPNSTYHQPHNTQPSLPFFACATVHTVGSRGPILLEDYHLVEKLAHFDRERIPERVVHARGATAKGFFEVGAWLLLSRPWEHAAPMHTPQCASMNTPVYPPPSTPFTLPCR